MVGIFLLFLLFSPFSLSEQEHPEQRDQPPVTGELHHHRGPPEDPAHVWGQVRRLPGPQFPKAASGHRLRPPVQGLRPGDPQRPLPKPDGDPW